MSVDLNHTGILSSDSLNSNLFCEILLGTAQLNLVLYIFSLWNILSEVVVAAVGWGIFNFIIHNLMVLIATGFIIFASLNCNS